MPLQCHINMSALMQPPYAGEAFKFQCSALHSGQVIPAQIAYNHESCMMIVHGLVYCVDPVAILIQL
jgi:hypothetical protein